MDQQPLYLWDRESPAARRRRRQSEQQSTCCSCMLVVVSALIALIVLWRPVADWRRQRHEVRTAPAVVEMFPLDLQANARVYYRHNLVRLAVRVVNPQGQPVKLDEPPRIIVRHDGDVVITVGGVRRLVPAWDAQSKSYVCHWPIPWSAESGVYVAEAEMKIADPAAWPWELQIPPDQQQRSYEDGTAYCIAQSAFEVAHRARRDIPPGLCVATWEPDFPQDVALRRPDGTTGDWRVILDWCEFVGADALWFRAGVTRQGCTAERPFVGRNLEAVARLAAAAHKRGLKFGVWATAYVTYPERRSDNRGLPRYEWGQDISRRTGTISDQAYISLFDQDRISHLAGFFRQMARIREVDFVGLDYLRDDPPGGYEIVDRFTSEMPVRLPDNWVNYSRKQRWKHLAQKVESEFDSVAGKDFYEQWNWWRAHLNAGNVEQIITQSGVEKPVWLFQLSWMHGAQHGQDAFMFNDAGVALIAPMLYQSPSDRDFDFLLEFWNEYAQPGHLNLAAGDQVDDFWHKPTRGATKGSRNPAAPEVLYERMVRAHGEMVEGERTIGGFWHDISRAAVLGRRGPYPGTEWALAGAAAFSQIRQSWELYPITVKMSVPDSAGIGATFTAAVAVENTTEATVRDILIKLEETEHISPVGQRERRVAELGPGESHTVPLSVRITRADATRANRYMVAARVNWAAGEFGEKRRADLPRTFVAIKYLNGT